MVAETFGELWFSMPSKSLEIQKKNPGLFQEPHNDNVFILRRDLRIHCDSKSLGYYTNTSPSFTYHSAQITFCEK